MSAPRFHAEVAARLADPSVQERVTEAIREEVRAQDAAITRRMQEHQAAQAEADRWNETYPEGTPVRCWSGVREGAGRLSRTRSRAWVTGGSAVVSVAGYAGGIALTHIEPHPGGLPCPPCPECGSARVWEVISCDGGINARCPCGGVGAFDQLRRADLRETDIAD
jgi:hypothetical protein